MVRFDVWTADGTFGASSAVSADSPASSEVRSFAHLVALRKRARAASSGAGPYESGPAVWRARVGLGCRGSYFSQPIRS